MNTKATIYNKTCSDNMPFISGECGTDRLQGGKSRPIFVLKCRIGKALKRIERHQSNQNRPETVKTS